MSSLARTRPTGAAPSRRPSGVVRATLYGPNVKPETDARAKRASIGTTACESGFGVASICVCWAECRNLQRHCLAESSCGVHTGCYTACDVAPVVTRGTLSIARSNPTSRWGLKRLLRATYFNAATQTIGVNRAPSLEMVIGVAAPITTSRSYAGHRFANIGHERALFPPASRAPGFCPADAGVF